MWKSATMQSLAQTSFQKLAAVPWYSPYFVLVSLSICNIKRCSLEYDTYLTATGMGVVGNRSLEQSTVNYQLQSRMALIWFADYLNYLGASKKIPVTYHSHQRHTSSYAKRNIFIKMLHKNIDKNSRESEVLMDVPFSLYYLSSVKIVHKHAFSTDRDKNNIFDLSV